MKDLKVTAFTGKPSYLATIIKAIDEKAWKIGKGRKTFSR
jgi:phenylacetate-coenzyme A ligase PaaK-like adenylate-forming protein